MCSRRWSGTATLHELPWHRIHPLPETAVRFRRGPAAGRPAPRGPVGMDQPPQHLRLRNRLELRAATLHRRPHGPHHAGGRRPFRGHPHPGALPALAPCHRPVPVREDLDPPHGAGGRGRDPRATGRGRHPGRRPDPPAHSCADFTTGHVPHRGRRNPFLGGRRLVPQCQLPARCPQPQYPGPHPPHDRLRDQPLAHAAVSGRRRGVARKPSLRRSLHPRWQCAAGHCSAAQLASRLQGPPGLQHPLVRTGRVARQRAPRSFRLARLALPLDADHAGAGQFAAVHRDVGVSGARRLLPAAPSPPRAERRPQHPAAPGGRPGAAAQSGILSSSSTAGTCPGCLLCRQRSQALPPCSCTANPRKCSLPSAASAACRWCQD